MLIKQFKTEEEFRYFLKDRGINVRLTERFAPSSNFISIFFEGYDSFEREILQASQASCVSCIKLEGGFLIMGSRESINSFCSKIVKSHRELAFEILNTISNYKKFHFRLEYNQKILNLGLKTAVMGVINLTPDSFSDGGLIKTPQDALERAKTLIEEGADIIDLGAESTRPNSERIDAKEELRRLIGPLELIRKSFPNIWISVDTYKSEVAKEALESGADIINDVTGGVFDERIYEVVSKYNCPYIIGHIRGRPETWLIDPPTYSDVMYEVISDLRLRLRVLKDAGYSSTPILDPGIGFGKGPVENLTILKRFSELRIFGLPTMVGVSRKSFLGLIVKEFLNRDLKPQERLSAGLGAIANAVMEGCHIVRTHDVAKTREFLVLIDAIRTCYGL
ncbi:MAG: dihydropteroate synthase [Aquificaceae bacterium]|nr:dihydropteroate synthase [Aquificaceae bacterium]MDW8236908.1 dihydropteroate synthase [Aquificaceae bacterium]